MLTGFRRHGAAAQIVLLPFYTVLVINVLYAHETKKHDTVNKINTAIEKNDIANI